LFGQLSPDIVSLHYSLFKEVCMINRRGFFVAAIAALMVANGASAKQAEDYAETINNFKQIENVAPFFKTAYGYAVFPTVGKAGLGIGGAYGKGQVYRDGKITGYTSVSQLSIGFQAGGQAYSQVIFLENQKAYDNFTSGNFEFSAAASAVAVTTSVQAQAGTGGGASAGASTNAKVGGSQAKVNYVDGMLVFVLGKGGLMYEAAISGQKYSFDPL
jgi:lipid-binding SYLF domain-containing protein